MPEPAARGASREPADSGAPVLAPGSLAALRARAGDSELLRTAGMALAMVATNVMALALTIVFGRILGPDGYGEVAALTKTFLILSVPGQALQLATARAGSLGQLGEGAALHATLARWTRGLVLFSLLAAALGVLARSPIAAVTGVSAQWGAAVLPVAAALWLLVCVQRGALQALSAYRQVGVSLVIEQVARLGFGAPLALTGLKATGAFLGVPLAIAAMSIALALVLHRRLAPAGEPAVGQSLRHHLRTAGTAIAGLGVVAFLQNIDVLVAKHRLGDTAAGAYAGAQVAAQVLVWVALGVSFYVVPEASRRVARGEDPRPVLLRGLAILGVAAVPTLAIYAAVPSLLLASTLGPKFRPGGDALLLLGLAFTLLAALLLMVQYLLALHRWRFLVPLGVVAVAEPLVLLLLRATRPGLAAGVLAVQAAAAVVGSIAVLRAGEPA